MTICTLSVHTALLEQVMKLALCLCRLRPCCSGRLITLRRGHSATAMTAKCPLMNAMRLCSPRCLPWMQQRHTVVLQQWVCSSPGSLQRA